MTTPTNARLEALKTKALEALAAVTEASALEAWRIEYLGRRGAVPQLLRQIKDLPPDQRRELGSAGNAARQELKAAFTAKQAEITPVSAGADVEDGPAALAPGHLHPLTQALRLTQAIFSDLGFMIVEGPHVEEKQFNFDGLNIPFDHPARAESDTYYLKGHPDVVLRTHVSPLQIRGVLENHLTPPFRIMYSGPSYRAEKEDATHGSLFQQYEFMVVDDKVNLANLKATAETFYSRFFETDAEIRFRPAYFPFVEPGLEVDMRDTATRKGGWLEMAGAGMVHPNVLRSINVDPARYQGIALGGGLDRLTMLKFNIPDIRLLYSGQLSVLRQF